MKTKEQRNYIKNHKKRKLEFRKQYALATTPENIEAQRIFYTLMDGIELK